MMITFKEQVKEAIKRALAEDLGGGDATTDALLSPEMRGNALFLAKEQGVLAGIGIARQVFLEVDPAVEMKIMVKDGTRLEKGDILGRVGGSLAGILKAERTALNFLQHLSGIATETARYVAAVDSLPVRILDTRKTTPGLRYLEKYAVYVGGGQNHRMNLSDGILIKDNHLEALSKKGLTIKDVVTLARQKAPSRLKIEVETETLDQVVQAADAGADIIMLDNMSPDMMREAVNIIRDRAKIEASGNITLDNVKAAAGTGVDYISIGSLTHSVKALDISLEFE